MRRQCRFIGGLIAGLLVGVSGGTTGCQTPGTRTASEIELTRRAVRSGQYSAGEKLADAMIRETPTDPSTAELLYLRGQCRLRLGRREAARPDFDRALALASEPELRMWLQVQVGNMEFDDGCYAQAGVHYARALPELPPEPPADRVLYQYGVALQRSQRFAEARRQFARLLTEFPDSSLADAAGRKWAWTDSYFCIQCGAFSRLDLARKSAERLRSCGIDTFLVRERRGQQRYLVLAGRIRSHDEATSTLAQVRRFQPDAFIVP